MFCIYRETEITYLIREIFDKGDNVYLHDLRNDTDNGVRRGVLYFYNTSRDVKLIGKDVSFVEKRHLYNQGRNVSANG